MQVTWFVLIVIISFTRQTNSTACPPWFVADNTSSTGCSCIGSPTAVTCGKNSPLLKLGFCMTYDSTTEQTDYGTCPYITHYNTTSADHMFYIELPVNVSLLNEFMCESINREGTLCGKCKDGYGTALYSYTLECSKCWEHGYEWVLYYFLELFPITVMYFLVVIFHIRATSSPLSALVFMSQIIVYTCNKTECTLARVHWEQSDWYPICGTESIASIVWVMELGLLSCCYSTILCKQQHQACACTCTWVYSRILSYMSHFTYLYIYV